jgi:hypothetical protein
MHPIHKFGISRIGFQSRIFTETPSSRPDRLHVTTLALEMTWSSYLGRCMSSRQACRLASLAEVCLSQLARRQVLRNFSQFACGLRMELTACSGRDFFHSRKACLERFTGRNSRSFRRRRKKHTLPQSPRTSMESLGAARGLVSLGGSVGHPRFKRRAP